MGRSNVVPVLPYGLFQKLRQRTPGVKGIPRSARVEISLDEPRVARGTVDTRSVRVKVKWQESQADAPVIEALKKLPKLADVEVLKRLDGGVELVPKSWRHMRFGPDEPTFFETARKTPGGLGPVRKVALASERAAELIRQYRPDFDSFTPEELAEFLVRTIKRLNEVSKSFEGLVNHLEYAEPGRKAGPHSRDPERAVMAAILSDVHDLSTLRVGEKLSLAAPANSAIKGENQTVRKMIDRGHLLLEQCFGAKGWCARVERMRAKRER
jgi:hypothetical protein